MKGLSDFAQEGKDWLVINKSCSGHIQEQSLKRAFHYRA